MKTHLIITGCRGFIGMNFINEIIPFIKSDNHNISGITLVDAGLLEPDKHWEWMVEENYKIYQQLESICKTNKLDLFDFSSDINDQTFTKIPNTQNSKFIVVNFASESHVDNSIEDPFSVFKQNSCLIPNLINWLGMNNIQEFVQIRTDEEYGQLDSSDATPFKLGDTLQPRNPYSSSKASQTLFLRSLEETFNLNVKYVVLANQYGSYQHFSKLIPYTIKKLLQGQPARIYGTGEELREWTFVEDTCKQLFNFIFNNEQDINEIHISNPKGIISNNDLVDKIIKYIDEKNITKKCKKEFTENRLGHDFCYKLESQDFDYEDFDSSLEQTIDFYINYYQTSNE